MSEQKDPIRKELRRTFILENAALLERCNYASSASLESDLGELVAKARVHFGYSTKTMDMDIRRSVLKAYRKHVAQFSAVRENERGTFF